MIPTLEVTFEKITFATTDVNKSSITNMTMESFPLSLCKGGASLDLKPFRDLRFVPKACRPVSLKKVSIVQNILELGNLEGTTLRALH
jgi:hypothetical protein